LLRVLTPVDHQIIMDMNAANIGGVQRFTINNVTYLPQNVPTLYTTLTVGDEYASNPTVYGQANPYVVKYGEVIEIIVNGYLENLHPFHLHGHQFQVMERTAPNAGYFPGCGNFSQTPMRRDTVMVQNQGFTVLRFHADNAEVLISQHEVSGNAAGNSRRPLDVNGSVTVVPTVIQGGISC
jgi:iron transport multicopper oxidase